MEEQNNPGVNVSLVPKGELSAKVFHPDGHVEDLGVVATDSPTSEEAEQFFEEFRESTQWRWPRWLLAPLLGFACAFGLVFGLVTNAGVNYMAADFLAASSARINAFNFQDSGTGTTAANVTDTALQTPSGGARVSGTQSNPTSNQYRSVATISYTSTLAITEWGLFSAASSGTLWDRRVFSAINVVNGSGIQFTYTLTIPSGGS